MAPNTAWSEHTTKSPIQLNSHGASWKSLVKECLLKSEIFKEKKINDLEHSTMDPNILMETRHKVAKTHEIFKSCPKSKEHIQREALKCLKEENHKRLTKQREEKLVKEEIEQLKQNLDNYQLSAKKAKDEIIKKRGEFSIKKEKGSEFDKRYSKLKRRFKSREGFCEVDTWVSRYVSMTMETKIDPEGIPLQVKVRLKRKTKEQSMENFSELVSCGRRSVEGDLSSRSRFDKFDRSKNLKMWHLSGQYQSVTVEKKNVKEVKGEKLSSNVAEKYLTRSDNWKMDEKHQAREEKKRTATEEKIQKENVEKSQDKADKEIAELKKKDNQIDNEYEAIQSGTFTTEEEMEESRMPKTFDSYGEGKLKDDSEERKERSLVVRCSAKGRLYECIGKEKCETKIEEKTDECLWDKKLWQFVDGSEEKYKGKIAKVTKKIAKVLSDNESFTKSNSLIGDFVFRIESDCKKKTDKRKKSEYEEDMQEAEKSFSECREPEIKVKERNNCENELLHQEKKGYENKRRELKTKEEALDPVICFEKQKNQVREKDEREIEKEKTVNVLTCCEAINECMDPDVKNEGKKKASEKNGEENEGNILGACGKSNTWPLNEKKKFDERKKNKRRKSADEYLHAKGGRGEHKQIVELEESRTGIGKANHFLVKQTWEKWRNYFRTRKKRQKEKAICEEKIEIFIKKLQERKRISLKKTEVTEKKMLILKGKPKIVRMEEKEEKLKKIIKELKESEKEIRERLSAFERQQQGTRETLKVLKNLSNVPEIEKTDQNINFLSRMEKRREERIFRRNEIIEKRKQIEEERKMREKEREKQLEEMKKEEKRRKVEEMKQKRRLELEKKEEEKLEKDAVRSKLRLAEDSYRKRLLRRFGLGPWMALLKAKRLQEQRAAVFSDETILRRSLLAWRQTAARALRQREEQAERLYEKVLRRKALRSWMKCRTERMKEFQVAADWSDFRLAERMFHKWREFNEEEQLRTLEKTRVAESEYKKSLKRKYLRVWRIYPNVKKLEVAKENRKRVWRQKVQEILPDYNPLEIRND